MTIYFIQCGDDGPIKIGHTKGLAINRLNNLKVYCPYKLTLLFSMQGNTSLEKQIHKELKQYKTTGEWFSPTPEVLNAIEKYKNYKIPKEQDGSIYLSSGAYLNLRYKIDLDKYIAAELGISKRVFMKVKKRDIPIPKDVYEKFEKIMRRKTVRKY